MFKIAVGRKETRAAIRARQAVPGMFCFTNEISGKRITAQGRSSGRLLAFAPVSRAAERADNQRSETRRYFHARNPKYTAANPYAVGKVSFAALPAWSRKV